MTQKKLVILSVSAGAGHVRAAEAIRETALLQYPDVEPIHLDVMDFVSKLFRKVYAESYLSIVERHPDLWGYIYNKSDVRREDKALKAFRLAIERLNTRKFMSHLFSLNPDHVICTHFLPAELLSRKIGQKKFNRPLWVQVTDFDVHSFWIQQHIDGFFAANSEVAFRMADRSILPQQVYVTGIPIMPAFLQHLRREQCAAELGIDPKKTTLLMMSGGFGVGRIDQLAERLLLLEGQFQVIALAGKNETLLSHLQSLARRFPGKLFPMGFTNTIERVMAVADIAITKPGGLTSSECLAMKLPMIVISPIPGQEERNADYLLESGAAVKAYDVAGLLYKVDMLLSNPERVAQMRNQAAAIGKPNAAQRVLEIVYGATAKGERRPAI